MKCGQGRHSLGSLFHPNRFVLNPHWLNCLYRLKMGVEVRLLRGAVRRQSMQSLPGQCHQLRVHDADLGVGYYLCSWEMPC
jgi:hypothetical protein